MYVYLNIEHLIAIDCQRWCTPARMACPSALMGVDLSHRRLRKRYKYDIPCSIIPRASDRNVREGPGSRWRSYRNGSRCCNRRMSWSSRRCMQPEVAMNRYVTRLVTLYHLSHAYAHPTVAHHAIIAALTLEAWRKFGVTCKASNIV